MQLAVAIHTELDTGLRRNTLHRIRRRVQLVAIRASRSGNVDIVRPESFPQRLDFMATHANAIALIERECALRAEDHDVAGALTVRGGRIAMAVCAGHGILVIGIGRLAVHSQHLVFIFMALKAGPIRPPRYTAFAIFRLRRGMKTSASHQKASEHKADP